MEEGFSMHERNEKCIQRFGQKTSRTDIKQQYTNYNGQRFFRAISSILAEIFSMDLALHL
jgi:hypothetical protein